MTDDAARTDPVTALENAAWALAAVVATERDAARGSLARALHADPARTAVLEAAGLVGRDGDELVPDPSLHDATSAAAAASARLGALRQAVDAAAGGRPEGWSAQSDDVLLDQGRASAATGFALATRLAPTLTGLAERLAAPGSRVLDVGTGVGALALALARELPEARVTGIDVLPRAVRLAHAELDQAGAEATRVEIREQDVVELGERDVYDLVWLPAPFLSEQALTEALPKVVAALTPGGWLVVGTNPTPGDELAATVARWNAVRNGGNPVDSGAMAPLLQNLGLGEVGQQPTFPGGPILVTGRRPVS